MINRRTVPRPKALWKQIQDAKTPIQHPARKPKGTRQPSFKAFKPLRPYIRGVSKVQAARNREYAQVEKPFLIEHPQCMVCGGRSCSVHHYRGKVGDLLCDTRFFVPMCGGSCHRGVHDNIEQSRKFGLICTKGEWNRMPRPDEIFTVPRQTPLGPGFRFDNQSSDLL